MKNERSGVSRRGVIKSVAAAVVVGPVVAAAGGVRGPSALAKAAPRGPRVTGPLRVGLIGCGGRGTGAAVQALRADPETVLVAMGDAFADRLNSSHGAIVEAMGDSAEARVQVPEEKRFVGFDAYQKVIEAGVDVVLLTSYPHFRPAHLRAAVEAGKHVFAEKPLAVDAPGVRSVIESCAVAEKKNLALVVGFCWRYNGGMAGAFDALHGGVIGDVVSVHTTYHTSTLSKRPRKEGWSDLEFQMRNWWHFNWISGDHIVEQACHSIDRLKWATRERRPVQCTALGGRAARSGPEHGDVFDHFTVIYDYADGTRAFHTCRQIDGCPSDNMDYVYGSKGSMVIDGWKPRYEAKDRAGNLLWSGKGSAAEVGGMYQEEHNRMFRSIREGAPMRDGLSGADSTLMAIMGRMAAYTGQTIGWEQALNSTQRLGPETYAWGAAPEVVVPIPGKTKFI
jgi:predicted dehydrogenase